jgi:hypothetical protein
VGNSVVHFIRAGGESLRGSKNPSLVVEAASCTIFITGFGYFNYVRPGHSLTLVLVFAAIAGILLAFFWTLSRFIR